MEQVNVSPCVSPTLNPFVSVLVCLCVSISMFGEHDCVWLCLCLLVWMSVKYLAVFHTLWLGLFPFLFPWGSLPVKRLLNI